MKKRIIAFLLILCLCFSVCGCGVSEGKKEELLPPDIPKEDGDSAGGTHDIMIKETKFDLISNSESDYKIVISENASSYEKIAASELNTFFLQSSGVDLSIINDKNLTYSADSKYLSIGKNSLFTGSKMVLSDNLGEAGYNIKTIGQTVFMVGDGQYGSLYAVYGFLHNTFGFETYSIDEISLDENVENKKLLDYDITDIPDIALRCSNYGMLYADPLYAKRMKMNAESEIWMNVDGNSWHNSFNYVPPEIYNNKADHPESYHPEWYSKDKTQLCFSQDGVRKTLEERLKKVILASSDVQNITITQQDIKTWCTCDKCKANFEKYGTDSATIIKFCNMVSRDLKDWLAEHNRKINICFFAYHKTEEAPVKYDEVKKEYVPIDDEVVCEDNVKVFYAPIYANYNYSVKDKVNVQMYDTMKRWSSLCKDMYLWVYSTNFSHYLCFFNSTNSMQSIYKYAKDCGAQYIFDQAQFNQNVSTAFGTYLCYINAKTQWNVNSDVKKLTDDFFTNYFKDAAEPMRKYYETQRTHYMYLRDHTEMDQGIYSNVEKKEYMPKGLLDGFSACIDDAYKAIEPLKNSSEYLYKTLAKRINLESISVRYLYIQVWGSSFTPDVLLKMKRDFRSDVVNLGVTNIGEHNSVNDLWTNWEI